MNANTYRDIFDGRDKRLTASQVAHSFRNIQLKRHMKGIPYNKMEITATML